MELEIWRKRINKEVQVCNEAWKKFDEFEAIQNKIEHSYLVSTDNKDTDEQYEQACRNKAHQLQIAQQLSVVLENLIAQYETACVEAEQHKARVEKTKELPPYHPLQTEVESLTQSTAPIQFSEKSYEDFMKDFKKRFKAQKDEYDEIMGKHKQPDPKPPYKPNVLMQPKNEKVEELSQQQIEQFKDKLLQAAKQGKTVEENIYKEFREKLENKKILKIIKIKDEAFKKSKEQAKDLAKELAQREFDFQNSLVEAKKHDKEMKQVESGIDKSKRLIEKVTGQNFTDAVANQYLQENQRKFVSQQAPAVITNKIGLGQLDEQKVMLLTRTSQEQLRKDISEIQKTQKIQVEEKVEDILGVPIEKIQPYRMNAKSRPASSQKKPKRDEKEKDKDKQPKAVSEESSSDPDPSLHVQYKQIELPRKKIPIVHCNTTTIEKTLKISQPLKKTIECIQEVNGKDVVTEKEVEDSTQQAEQKGFVEFDQDEVRLQQVSETLNKLRPAFVSQPAVINFYNFEQFVELQHSFVVANNSPILQSFKVEQIEEAYQNMFQLNYTPPGMMAPGQTIKIVIKFTYNNQNIYEIGDVHTKVVIRYNGGEFHVPINCYQKKDQMQLFDNKDTVQQQFQKFQKDESLNFKITEKDIQRQQSIDLGTQISGQTTKYLYLLNSGLQDAKCELLLNSIIVNDTEAQCLSGIEVQQKQSEIQTYDQKQTQIKDKIVQEYEQYKQTQVVQDKKAPKQKAVTLTYDYTKITEETLQSFIAQTIVDQLGQKPQAVDSNIATFRKLVGFNENDSFVQSRLPEILLHNGSQYDEGKLKEEQIAVNKEQCLKKAKSEATEQVEQLRDAEIQAKAKAKKNAKDVTTVPLQDEAVFNQKVDEISQELFKKYHDEFLKTLDIYQQILKVQKNSDIKVTFIVPRQSLLRIPYFHEPKTSEFNAVVVNQKLNVLNKRNDVKETFAIRASFNTYTTPVQLLQKDINFQTCFYNQQYNQIFNIVMTQSQAANVSRQVKINIPKHLKEFIFIDQNNLVINAKQDKYSPKVSINIKDKKTLTSLKYKDHEDWSNFQVSKFDQYFDSNTTLGLDLKQKMQKIEEISQNLEKLQKDIKEQETNKAATQQKIQETEAILAQPVQKNQKPPKIAVPLEDLKKQLEEINGKIVSILEQVEQGKLQLKEINYDLDTVVTIGSFLCLQFNLQIVVSQQPETLYLPIKINFTINEIETDIPCRMELQDILCNHQTSIPLYVQNNSALSQHVGILIQDNMCLRKDLQAMVFPHGGVELMFPGERKIFNIVLRPNYEFAGLLNVQIMGEYGHRLDTTLKFKAVRQTVEVLNPLTRIPEVSVNDVKTLDFTLVNRSEKVVQFTVCQAFLDFVQKELQGMIIIAPSCDMIQGKQRKNVQITFDVSPLNAAYMLDYLDKNPENKSEFQFARRILPGNEGILQEFIEINVPFMTSVGEFMVYACRFMLRGPIVSVVELGKEEKLPSRSASPVKESSKEVAKEVPKKEAPPPPKPVKGKKPATPEIKEARPEIVIQPVNVKNSKIVVDFGQCPLGSINRKEVQLQLKGKAAYVIEKSIAFYNADIEMKSCIHKKKIQNQKTIIFEFLPRKAGVQQEFFEYEAYGDKACQDEKLNNIQVIVQGEGVVVQVVVDLVNQQPEPVVVVTKEKQAPQQIQQEIIRHFIKPLNLQQTASIQLNLQNKTQFKFYCDVVQTNNSSYFKSFIYNQKQMMEVGQQLTASIEIIPINFTKQFEILQFQVRAGNFAKKIDVMCCCCNGCIFVKYNDQVYCCATEAVNGEVGQNKFQVAPGKIEVMKSTTGIMKATWQGGEMEGRF